MTFIHSVTPDIVKDLAGMGKIKDINKASGGLRMELFGVYSNNIPDATMNKVREMLECKYIGVLNELVQEVITQAHMSGNDPLKAVRERLSNKGYSVNVMNNPLSDKINMNESTAEAIKGLIGRVVFNEQTLQGTALPLSEAKGEGGGGPHGHNVPTVVAFDYPAVDRDVARPAGQEISRTPDGKPIKSAVEGKVQFSVRVSLMNVEADKVVDIVGTSRERTNLFNYIRVRAGAGSFFKDFILNLKEIDKQVERDTSQNLTDRLLGSMVRSAGLINPLKMGDLTEAKYYIMTLEQSDLDVLRSKYNFNLNKPNALHTLFNTFNILSLVVVDTTRKTMRMYDSDNPLKSTIFSYDNGGDPDQIASLFAALARKN
jgi:hypothetical protein